MTRLPSLPKSISLFSSQLFIAVLISSVVLRKAVLLMICKRSVFIACFQFSLALVLPDVSLEFPLSWVCLLSTTGPIARLSEELIFDLLIVPVLPPSIITNVKKH